MTNNQTSLKLTKLQQKQVSSIVKENGKYTVCTENEWVLFGQTSIHEYNTLNEVKEAIKNIIPFFTTQEKADNERQMKIRSLKDDYRWAKRTGNEQDMKEALKELSYYGIKESDL